MFHFVEQHVGDHDRLPVAGCIPECLEPVMIRRLHHGRQPVVVDRGRQWLTQLRLKCGVRFVIENPEQASAVVQPIEMSSGRA